MRIISVHFENNSIHICTTAVVQKFRATFVVQRQQYGTSFMLIFRWKEFYVPFLFLYNSFKLLFTLFGIELKVNVITIQLSLLNVMCIFGPIEHNTFTLGILLFCTTCFGCLYCLTSGIIATMQMENITEVDVSLLQLHVS